MIKTLLAGAAFAALAASPVAAQTATPAPGPAGAYPLEYWAAQETVSNVSLSPDGELMAMLVTPGLGVDPIIQVFETGDLTKEPKRYGADNLKINGFRWVSNEMMAVDFVGQVRERIRGFNNGTFRRTVATLNAKKGGFNELSGGRIVSSLPTEPNKVLIIDRDDRAGASNYYIADVKKGSRRLVLKGNQDVFSVGFDDRGNPREAQSVKLGGGPAIFQTLYRKPGDRSWTTIYEQSEDSFETFSIQGYFEDPRYIYVTAHNGQDKTALWKFDTQEKQFVEELLGDDEVDVFGVREHSDSYNHPDVVVGTGYIKGNLEIEYFDTEVAKEEETLFARLQAAIPNAHFVRIRSRSTDGDTMVVQNVGPKDPGSFYLLDGNQLAYISSVNPFVDGEGLGELRYIKYQARDGRTIPAYVTMPTYGEAPYPTVVLPHGGPFVPEFVTYDKWSQMLANRGYMVIQPSYRGTLGYGLDHYTSAFLPTGQGGYAMQDDKDDGALHLVKEGLADPDQLMLFGWSYGGYAAVTAAAREDQIYKCAIAGASVPDIKQQVNYYKDRLRGSGGVAQKRMWGDSFNPIAHPEKVNIPLLIIHGTSDQRTPLRGAKDYMNALDRAGSSYKYVELPKADHFFGSIGYDNELKAYGAMMDFLANDCGMPTERNPAG